MPNRLAGETSPYLRQHAENPVDWFPWGPEAFQAARDRDVPIFLSVGYSACHWCHVMAHESFEDDATAAVVNELFVNVKVDREERPDVDAVYMQAVQALSGRGGWPMSVWCTPDGKPFYGGTYYPPTDRPGMPSFVRVCEAVAEAWRDRRADLHDQAAELTRAIRESAPAAGTDTVRSLAASARALARLRDQFDERFGGFGRAPKFPQPTTLELLARTHARTGASPPLEMLTTTLDAMAAGGIHDHLGGGFARYSTDAFWLVPHFEKMLYDNALLARVYLYGHLLTGDDRYRRVVEDTIGYVLRDLAHPRGGFCAAEDADSEGVEGKFYLWDVAEIRAVCGEDADAVIRYYGVTEAGNFVDPHTSFAGNILHAVDRAAVPTPDVERCRVALFAARAARVRPGLDDKVLLGWNALFVRALAEAGAALGRDDWTEAARAAMRFLLTALRRDDGRLLRSLGAPHLAYAEDHAALLQALVTLAELDDASWLVDARAVADELLRLFHDVDAGGFFTTGHDAERLVVRAKDLFDDATPPANGMAADGLLRLAALTGDDHYRDVAAGTVAMLGPTIEAHPTACTAALLAVERLLSPPIEVVVVGDAAEPASRSMRAEVARRVLPPAVSLFVEDLATAPAVPLLAGRTLLDGRPTAFVCERYACRLPVGDAAALRAQLDDVVARVRAEGEADAGSE